METWKAIPGWENYEINLDRKVRSLNYRMTGKIQELKQILDNGYLQVNLSKKGKIKTFKIQVLMAMTFLGHVPEGHNFVVDHKNNNPLDNRLKNLQIITNRENCTKDKKRDLPTGVGFLPKRKKSYNSRININGKLVCLGYYKTPEEASEAYQNQLKNLC
jgi:hypothetical protein